MKRSMPPYSPPGSFWSLFDRPSGWLFFVFFLAMGFMALAVQNRIIDGYEETPFVDRFSLPQPEYVKRLALGYDSFMADMLFLRSIQSFGGVYFDPDPSKRNYAAVFNYFDVISELDPHFMEAYYFGQLVMGDESKRYEMALDYLRKGQWNNWRRYEPWYNAAYIKTYSLEEVDDQAKFFVRMASRAHDAPDWVGRLELAISQQAGEFGLALMGWIQSYAQSADSGDTMLAGIARNRFASTISAWHQRILENAVEKYREDRGSPPDSLLEIEEAGYLPPVEIIDLDALMQNLQAYELVQGKLAPHVDEIYQASLREKGGILPNVSNPGDPFVLVCLPGSRRVVDEESGRVFLATAILAELRGAIEAYQAEHGQYPPSPQALGLPEMTDPYCKGWDYDPATGKISTPGNPQL